MNISMRSSWKSYFLVSLQFLCLGIIFVSGPWLSNSLFLLIPELVGWGLGIWAVLVMGLGNFHITPDPVARGKMVYQGPYRIIRHPMYLALLLVTLPLVLDYITLLRVFVWLVLLATLVYKMSYEEKLLQARFDFYREYTQNTSRLIPGLY